MTKGADGQFYPAIARDGPKVHMVWTGKEGVLYLNSRDGGETWAPIVTLTAKGGMPFIATSGDAVNVIFRSQRDGHPAIYFKCDPTGNKATAVETKTP